MPPCSHAASGVNLLPWTIFGFDGELRITHRWCWRRADTVFVLGWGTFFALARAFDLPRAIGTALGGVLA